MADNTQLSVRSGDGDTIRDLQDVNSVKWPTAVVSYATTISAGNNSLQIVTLTTGLPVQPQTNSVWTTAAGTDLNTSALALESGGNLSSINTYLAAMNTKLQASVAVTQSGNWPTSLIPTASGGLDMYQLVSAANTNNTVVKNTAGQIYEIVVATVNSGPLYLKLYDSATAPVVGSTTPKWTLMVPGNANGAGLAKTIPEGLAFASGIAFGLSAAMPTSDNTAVSANTTIVNLGYK